MTARTNGKNRTSLLALIKACIGFGMLAGLLLWNDNGARMLEVFSGFQWGMIVALLAVGLSANLISSVKWNLFLRDTGVWVSQAELFGVYLIGRFFNNFLPSMLGGDVARSYMLGKQINSHSVSAASVIMERVTGMVALAGLAGIFYWMDDTLAASSLIGLSIAIGASVCAVIVLLYYWTGSRRLVLTLCRKLPVVGKITPKVERLFESLDYIRDRHQLLAYSMVYSVAFHLMASIHVYVASLAVGLNPDFLHILVITPVVLMLSIIPVSPNNVGWTEWCYSLLLAHAGATTAEGLAVALTIRANTFAISLIGGLLLVCRKQAQGAS